MYRFSMCYFFFQAEDGIRDVAVTGVQTCALPIYIEHRLKVAGYSGDPLFAPDALALIAEQSQGIPREINNICFNVLLLGAARKHQTISAEIAREAKEHQTIGAEIAREVLPNITADSIVPQPQTQGSPPAITPYQTSPPSLFDGNPFIEPA